VNLIARQPARGEALAQLRDEVRSRLQEHLRLIRRRACRRHLGADPERSERQKRSGHEE
jgi:hypothetical protein